jgi:hypothetical protein
MAREKLLGLLGMGQNLSRTQVENRENPGNSKDLHRLNSIQKLNPSLYG